MPAEPASLRASADAMAKAQRSSDAAAASARSTAANGSRAKRRVSSATPAHARGANDTRRDSDERHTAATPALPGTEREGGRTELVQASSLAEETRLMERAMVALGEGDGELARRSLEEHARRFPAGLLQRERERALGRLRRTEHEPPPMGSSR